MIKKPTVSYLNIIRRFLASSHPNDQ